MQIIQGLREDINHLFSLIETCNEKSENRYLSKDNKGIANLCEAALGHKNEITKIKEQIPVLLNWKASHE